MDLKKETFYILNEKIVRDKKTISIRKNKKILWYCDMGNISDYPDISEIVSRKYLDYDFESAVIFEKSTGKQIAFSKEKFEEFENWKNNLSLEELLDIVIEVHFNSFTAKMTKEYYFEMQQMIKPTKERKAKLFHLMVSDGETEKIIEKIDYSDFIEIINHCKQYIKLDKQALEKYIFTLNDIDITNCFKNGDDKSYITAESEYDECSFSIVV